MTNAAHPLEPTTTIPCPPPGPFYERDTEPYLPDDDDADLVSEDRALCPDCNGLGFIVTVPASWYGEAETRECGCEYSYQPEPSEDDRTDEERGR